MIIMSDGGGVIAEGAKGIMTSMTKLHRGTYKYIMLICVIIIYIINLLSNVSAV